MARDELVKIGYAFFCGLVFGAASMLVFLGESGRLVPRTEGASLQESDVVEAPGGETHAAREPVTEPADDARPARGVRVEEGTLLIPVAGVSADELTPMFDDPRGGGRAHRAIDIMAPRGRPVLAVADGTIRKLFLSRPGGITIYQESADGTLMYYYAHLERYADGIEEGGVVRRGDVIAFVGSSGNANPDAPHLHFAIFRLPPGREWWKGEAIDPYPLLRAPARVGGER